MSTITILDPKVEQRLQRCLAQLEEFYPDKIVSRLDAEHKKLGEKLSLLYKEIGYQSRIDLLSAYGFAVLTPKGGRPTTTNPKEVLVELHKRYEGKELPSATNMLAEQNPDLSGQIKTLQNKSKELFGDTLKNVLIKEGLLQAKLTSNSEANRRSVQAMLDKLVGLYGNGNATYKTITDLQKAHPEFSNEFNSLQTHCKEWFDTTPIRLLKKLEVLDAGVASRREQSGSHKSIGTKMAKGPQCTNSTLSFKAPCSVPANAYQGNECIESIVIKPGRSAYHKVYFGKNAFAGCPKLTSIEVENPEKCCISFGERSLSGCPSITSLDMPSVVEIRKEAFSGCDNLLSVAFRTAARGNSGISIGDKAFDCINLRALTFESGISLSGSPFSQCPSLTRLSFSSAKGNIDSYRGIPDGCQVTFSDDPDSAYLAYRVIQDFEQYDIDPSERELFYDCTILSMLCWAIECFDGDGSTGFDFRPSYDYYLVRFFRSLTDYFCVPRLKKAELIDSVARLIKAGFRVGSCFGNLGFPQGNNPVLSEQFKGKDSVGKAFAKLKDFRKRYINLNESATKDHPCSVKDLAEGLKQLSANFGESWNPELVIFNIHPCNVLFPNTFNIVPCRTASKKLVDDKMINAKDLMLDVAPVQDRGYINVPWPEFKAIVGNGKSEKQLVVMFGTNIFTETRFSIDSLRYDDERNVIYLDVTEMDPADVYL